MNDLVVLVLATLVGSGGVAGLVTTVMNRQKVGAETGNLDAQAAEIIERTAGQSVERLSRENVKLEAKIEELERKVSRLERRELSQRDLMQIHAAWDFRAVALLRKHLSEDDLVREQLEPPPPLYPPT